MARVEIDEGDAIRRIGAALAGGLDRVGRESLRVAESNTPDHPDTPGPIARESLRYEVDRDGLAVRLGSPLLKFRFLEIGTVHHAPRAPLRRTLDELGPRYPEILARG